MGQVSFSAHGSGFGFLDFAQVKNILLWSGQTLLHFSVNFGCIISKISQNKLRDPGSWKIAQVGFAKKFRVGISSDPSL